ncbi:hypothetical protein EYF80_048435 [Liparis tanakae]|uniref:Uncharacterized protein n=1 Tax=Liparis tanakae TaxID=230148 RepID=A0A4Z2FJU3_9TELE|nr:hypothetical protein EYF80_048435 [Liparis tanakae]
MIGDSIVPDARAPRQRRTVFPDDFPPSGIWDWNALWSCELTQRQTSLLPFVLHCVSTLPGLVETQDSGALAQLTRSLAPQTLLLASSPIQSICTGTPARWEDTIHER